MYEYFNQIRKIRQYLDELEHFVIYLNNKIFVYENGYGSNGEWALLKLENFPGSTIYINEINANFPTANFKILASSDGRKEPLQLKSFDQYLLKEIQPKDYPIYAVGSFVDPEFTEMLKNS